MNRPDPSLYPDRYKGLQRCYGFYPQADLERFRDIVISGIAKEADFEKELLTSAEKFLPKSDDWYSSYKDVCRCEHALDEILKIKELLYELIMLSLYRSLEVNILWVIGNTLPFIDKTDLHKITVLHSKLPFMKGLYASDSIEELRLINNCIKHSGKVSLALSKHSPCWVKDAQISNLSEAYDRIAPYIGAYWIDFCNKVHDFANEYQTAQPSSPRDAHKAARP